MFVVANFYVLETQHLSMSIQYICQFVHISVY